MTMTQLVKYDTIGKDWVAHFLSHHAELKSIRKRYIEAARIKDVSVEWPTKWFEDLPCIIEENNIESKNTYNIDESGFAIGNVVALQCISNATICQLFQAKPGRQKWVMALKCICANGSFLPPFIIFKGEKLIHQWISVNIHKDWQFDFNTKR